MSRIIFLDLNFFPWELFSYCSIFCHYKSLRPDSLLQVKGLFSFLDSWLFYLSLNFNKLTRICLDIDHSVLFFPGDRYGYVLWNYRVFPSLYKEKRRLFYYEFFFLYQVLHFKNTCPYDTLDDFNLSSNFFLIDLIFVFCIYLDYLKIFFHNKGLTFSYTYFNPCFSSF